MIRIYSGLKLTDQKHLQYTSLSTHAAVKQHLLQIQNQNKISTIQWRLEGDSPVERTSISGISFGRT